jgi:hypothetical protein
MVLPSDEPITTPIPSEGCTAFQIGIGRCGKPIEFAVNGKYRKFSEAGAPKKHFKNSFQWAHIDLLCSEHYQVWREQFRYLQKLIKNARRR